MSPFFAIPPIVGMFHCPDLAIMPAGTFDVAQPPLPLRFLPRVLRAVAAETG
ncbi:MAG: hypothetical protein ACLFRT_03530 [Actinomycetota bacterium]